MVSNMNVSYDFSGKHFVVTGASSGIGRATAVFLSKCGARLSIVARRQDMLDETLSLMSGEGHKAYSYDLSDPDGIEALVKQMVSDSGPLSGMVYCAGNAEVKPLKFTKTASLEKTMKVNFYSFVEFIRCIAAKGNYTEHSSLVAISSISSQVGTAAKTAYCASKAAMDAAVRCIAKELSAKKIRVNSIQPSWVNTQMLCDYNSDWGDTDFAKNSMAKQLLGITDPDEIAAMAAYLLSDAAKTITGSAVRVDSGYLS